MVFADYTIQHRTMKLNLIYMKDFILLMMQDKIMEEQ